MAYVYVIAEQDAESPVKIGFSEDCRARLDTLQTGNPRLLELRALFRIESRAFAYEVENRAHRHFSSDGVRGEWFDIDVETAVRLIHNIAGGRVMRLGGRQQSKWETLDEPQNAASV